MIDFSRIYYSREHPHSEGHLEMRHADFQDSDRLYQPKILFYNFLKLNYSYQNAENIPTKFERKKGVLAKARMMAGDSEIIDLNIQTTSFVEIKIEFEEKFLLMIPRCTPLPYKKTIKNERKTATSNQFFEVLEDDVDPAKSKKYEKFFLTDNNDLVTIKIDENNVYAIEQNQSSE
uniref:Uncharacterized protein n=1 Tax=Panagrolaimus sp. ES5 TaxID=591445 RepID=A0AC34FBC0_9BILA